MIALWLAGCTLTWPGEITENVGVAEEPGDSAEGDTGDTGVADTRETGVETGSDTSVDTSVDTADTGTVTPPDYIAPNGATMIYLTGGSFTMGGGVADAAGSYVDHDVTLTHDFYLAQTETTRGEWESDPSNTSWTYESNSWGYHCADASVGCPADGMSWYEAVMYANWLSLEDGLTECYRSDGRDIAAAYLADPYACSGYRLPTEAEWEYAARAGVDTTYSGSNTATDVAWTVENAYGAHASCSLAANAWGFCDMSGNLWEWTNDWFDPAHGGYGDGSADVDPAGPLTFSGEGWEGRYRVIRGGDWVYTASEATVAFRYYNDPSYGNLDIGFRLARSIVP